MTTRYIIAPAGGLISHATALEALLAAQKCQTDPRCARRTFVIYQVTQVRLVEPAPLPPPKSTL